MQTTNQNWTIRFIPLWIGQALSLLGSQLVQFAIIWYLTQETNSATTLAVASMMGLLPQVLLSPFIGTWVDRGNRRLILITADSTIAIATLILAVLFASGLIQVWQIYVVLFIRAVASGFHQSAFGASVVLLVPKEQLSRVQGFNQALYGGLNIISAPLGAYLLALLPMQGILGIDVGTASLDRTSVGSSAANQRRRPSTRARPPQGRRGRPCDRAIQGSGKRVQGGDPAQSAPRARTLRSRSRLHGDKAISERGRRLR